MALTLTSSTVSDGVVVWWYVRGPGCGGCADGWTGVVCPMVTTDVVRGGGGGAGFLPDGGNWMGTTVDVSAVGVTGEVTTLAPPPLLSGIGTIGDDKLRLSGRAIDVPAMPEDTPA